MCNKISYPDKSATLDAIKFIKGNSRTKKHKSNQNDKHKKMKPYRCNHCLYWHITTTAKAFKWRKTVNQRQVRHENRINNIDAELKELFQLVN